MQTVYARGGAGDGGGSQEREVADGADVAIRHRFKDHLNYIQTCINIHFILINSPDCFSCLFSWYWLLITVGGVFSQTSGRLKPKNILYIYRRPSMNEAYSA